MATEKFYGIVGYATEIEDPNSPGSYIEDITEYNYYGEVISNSYRRMSGDYINNDFSVTTTISIFADAYAFDNYTKIKYVIWEGNKWEVTNVQKNRPRLQLYIGGLYNGNK